MTQFSLRELLCVVLLMGLGLSSLRAGGALASVMVFLALLLAMGVAIVAFVGRDGLQAFAIGFLIPIIAYGGIVLVVGQDELDPYEGKLPTSQLLLPMFELMSEQSWINTSTGDFVPDYDPTKVSNQPWTLSPMGLSESPDRTTFMSLGHILIALMFGYAGAKFSVAVYRKQHGG